MVPPIFNKNVIALFLLSSKGKNRVDNGYALNALVVHIDFGLLKAKNPLYP